jgi:iron complex outermembrane receptor protein
MFELLSDGVHEGTNRYEIGNANLKTENSYQADVSMKYTGEHLELFVNPYFNYIRHFIYLQPAGFHFHPHPWDWLHFESSFANTFGQNVKRNDLPLMPSQKLNVTIRANISGEKVIRKFSIWLQEQYSLAQNRVAAYEEPTPAYHLLNAGLSLDLKAGKQKMLLSATLNNILNETYYDHLSRYKQERIYNMGRNVNLQLNLLLQF